MNLAISSIALWMLISFEVAYCASLKDADRKIVKRDVDIIPAVISGAVGMSLDLLDRFGKGFAIRGGSKFDGFGLHDEKNFEAGTSDAAVSNDRSKRAALPCGRKNETVPVNGTSSTVNRRNASNPDVETLARRKRSAQSNGNPPNGNPPNGPPPNGPPPNGPPPNGPPPNGPPPDGFPPNCTKRPGDGASQNGAQTSVQIEETKEPDNLVREKRTPCRNATELRSKRSAPENPKEDSQQMLPKEKLVREKRTPCRNATELRSKRSPQRTNDDFPSQQNEARRQLERDNKDKDGNGQGQNVPNENKNLNGYGGRSDNPNDRVKRSAKPCNGQNGNGQPIGAPTNNIPQQQLPPQQQQQQPAGVNIGDLQRDQNQRTRRNVNDPDKVVPGSNIDDKNLFERIVQVTKEVFSRVARWVDDMDKEMSNLKTPSEKPK